MMKQGNEFLSADTSPQEEVNSLVQKCLNQDSKAQEDLYNRFAPKMYGICLRYSESIKEAEKVLEKAFVKVFKNLKNFDTAESLESWIKNICVETYISTKRQKLNKLPLGKGQDRDLSGLDEEVNKLSQEVLLKCIQSLPLDLRVVWNLSEQEGYQEKEIATLIRCSDNIPKIRKEQAQGAFNTKIWEVLHQKGVFSE